MVIGVGRTYDGWAEIDAYGWRPDSKVSGGRHQVCTSVEAKGLPAPSYGSCFVAAELSAPVAIESFAQIVGPKPPRSALVAGSLAPEVRRVELTVQRDRGEKPELVRAVVARVNGDLMRELHQQAPFGYFFAKVRGAVPVKGVRATAYDGDGRRVGSTSGLTPSVVRVQSRMDSDREVGGVPTSR